MTSRPPFPLVVWRRIGPSLVAGVLALAVTALFAACGGDNADGGDASCEPPVTGQVREVEARTLLEIESLVIEDRSGTRWTFAGGDGPVTAFTPSHIREHMVAGEPVSVSYRDEDGVLVVCDVTD